MSKYALNGYNAADAILSYYHDIVRANPNASPMRAFSSYIKAKGIDTLFVRVHPTAVPRCIVISSISMAAKVMGKGTFTAMHSRLKEFAVLEDFNIEYENVLTGRFQHWLARNEPFAFISGHSHEYERDLLSLDKLQQYAASERANPDSNMSPRAINITCPQTFRQWLRYAIQRAVNAPTTPINPLYYNGGTSLVSVSNRWPGDLNCMLTTLSEVGQQARVLIVRDLPADTDFSALVSETQTAYRNQYQQHVPRRLFVTMYRVDDYGFQLDLDIDNARDHTDYNLI